MNIKGNISLLKYKYITLPMVTLCMLVSLTGCSSHPHFKNSGEAIKACNKELAELREKKSASMQQLSKDTKKWLEIQDSTFSVFARDSVVKLHSPIAMAYFVISDSIRIEISRLAMSQERTLKDVMYFRLNTSKEKDKVSKSKEYKKALEFYEKLDKENLYPNLPKTLNEYDNLLRNVKPFKTDNDIISFIEKEDVCFRSLLAFLTEVPQEQMQYLTVRTSKIFESLYSIVGKNSDSMNDRIMLYLTMRFNRRIIQNAYTCRDGILKNVKLNQQQKADYRWMLIQPYLTLDSYAVATMTKEQTKSLITLSEELPSLLSRLDDKKSTKESQKNLEKVLATYFLKQYLTTL